MDIHFINVGCGNMVLIRTSTHRIVYDCNITEENKKQVLGYLGRVLGANASIGLFVRIATLTTCAV